MRDLRERYAIVDCPREAGGEKNVGRGEPVAGDEAASVAQRPVNAAHLRNCSLCEW